MQKKYVKIGFYVGVVLVAYFGNVALQSHWGRQAVEATGLEILSLEQALTKAKAENKLVLADLSAIWCASCRKFDEKVLSDARVRAAVQRDFVFARIEYESEAGTAFAEKYKVSGFPNLLILDSEGTMKRHLDLTFEPERFLTQLER
ncbi:Thioredoxin family protein [Sulfidibacter corallicola]